MNLDYLKAFLEVVRCGSFSQVAKKMSVTQPAISFQINKLEQELGVRLLDRSQKTISVTTAGKRLVRFAETIETKQQRLMHDLDEMRDEVSGELVIAASTIPGEFLLPPLLASFKKLHPTIKLQVTISDSFSVISGIRNGSYEVGCCGVSPESKDINYFRIAEDEIVLIVNPEHPFASRKEIAPAELESESFIFREETSGTQKSLESEIRQAGVNLRKAETTMILTTTQAVVSAVEAGAGIAFVSNRAITKSLQLGLVRQVNISGLTMKRDFFCIFRQGRMTSRLLEEFIDYLRVKSSAAAKEEKD